MRRQRVPEGALKLHKGVAIRVSNNGSFYATVGLDHLSADRLVDLEKLIDKATKKVKVKVAVPVSVLGRKYHEPQYGRPVWVAGDGVQHVTLLGVHAGTGNLIYRDDKTGDVVQANRFYHRNEFVRRLTDAQVEEYTKLHKAHRAAEEAHHEFVASVALDAPAQDLVQAAIRQKVDDPVEPEEDQFEGDPR